jgi:hypothetical protein
MHKMGVRKLINYVNDLIQRAWKMFSDIQFLALIVAIGAIGTNICGNRFWAVLFLSYAAVFADTLTKWIAVTKAYYHDHELKLTTWLLIVNIVFHGPAWSTGYLESRKLGRILEKLLTYTVVITLCHAAGKWLPVLDLFGLVFNPATVFPASASAGVFLIEFKSINENLKEMGQAGLSEILSNLVSAVSNKIFPNQGGLK